MNGLLSANPDHQYFILRSLAVYKKCAAHFEESTILHGASLDKYNFYNIFLCIIL